MIEDSTAEVIETLAETAEQVAETVASSDLMQLQLDQLIQISDLLTYIAGFLLFLMLCVLLRIIYKFFNIFF